MQDYQHATDKPNYTLINYNTVRAAELKAIYESIVSGTETQTLLNRFSPPKNENGQDSSELNKENVQDCLDFLRDIDFLDYTGDARVLTPINTDVYSDFTFEARVLHHLRQQEHPRDHLTRIQGVALDTADRSIILENLFPEVKSELDSDYDFDWNKTKLRMWRSLVTQLGLVSQTKSKGIILSPSRALIHELFLGHQTYKDSDGFYDVLSWIESNFFDVFKTHTGTPTVHPAISDVLQNMEEDGILTLRGMADAKNEVRLPESNYHRTARAIKEYQVEESPSESVAYQYPLAQFELEATQ